MSERPNVIFFFSDQQRWDTVGCYGQKLNVTPNLDALAEKGTKFENAFTVQPVCGPARAVLQTGMYATETGCYRNGIRLPEDSKTMANYFNEAGYETAYIGKWHLASTMSSYEETEHDPDDYFHTTAVPSSRRGGYKDYWMAADLLEFTSHGYGGYMFDGDMNKIKFDGYRADCTTDYALDYMRGKKSEDPFFMMVSYIEPHHQNDRNTYEGPEGSKEKFKNFDVPGDLADEQGDWKENYPDYLGCCNSLDYNLGRIIVELKQQGIDDNTVIFYTSDHGSHFKTRNDEYKRSCHEGSIRIPMIAYGPGFEGGQVIDEIVSLIDVVPTLLESAGIKKPEQMKGTALQRLTEHVDTQWTEEALIQISESQVGRAIRTAQWKYSVKAMDKDGWLDAESESYTEEFLYDLSKDPYEKNNLVEHIDYREIRSDLAIRLKGKMVEAGEKEPIILEK